jgi:hypothetical protein
MDFTRSREGPKRPSLAGGRSSRAAMHGVMIATIVVAALRLFRPLGIVMVAAVTGRAVEIDGSRISFPARNAGEPAKELAGIS